MSNTKKIDGDTDLIDIDQNADKRVLSSAINILANTLITLFENKDLPNKSQILKLTSEEMKSSVDIISTRNDGPQLTAYKMKTKERKKNTTEPDEKTLVESDTNSLNLQGIKISYVNGKVLIQTVVGTKNYLYYLNDNEIRKMIFGYDASKKSFKIGNQEVVLKELDEMTKDSIFDSLPINRLTPAEDKIRKTRKNYASRISFIAEMLAGLVEKNKLTSSVEKKLYQEFNKLSKAQLKAKQLYYQKKLSNIGMIKRH